MSKVYATVNKFVGFGGLSVWLGEGDEYDADNPLVKAMPKEYFTEPADDPKRPARAARRG